MVCFRRMATASPSSDPGMLLTLLSRLAMKQGRVRDVVRVTWGPLRSGGGNSRRGVSGRTSAGQSGAFLGSHSRPLECECSGARLGPKTRGRQLMRLPAMIPWGNMTRFLIRGRFTRDRQREAGSPVKRWRARFGKGSLRDRPEGPRQRWQRCGRTGSG